MQIRWSRRAAQELHAAFDYILLENEGAAYRTIDLIEELVERLAEYPSLGRAGRVGSSRELVIPRTPYIVAYTVDLRRELVVIQRVLHGAQAWPTEL